MICQGHLLQSGHYDWSLLLTIYMYISLIPRPPMFFNVSRESVEKHREAWEQGYMQGLFQGVRLLSLGTDPPSLRN